MTNDYRSLVLAAGENYRLVPFDVTFTEVLFEAVYESRHELIRFVSWYYPEYSMEDSRRWLQARERERSERRAYDFAITEAGNGDLVGGCGIDRIESRNCRATFIIGSAPHKQKRAPPRRPLERLPRSAWGPSI